MLLTTLASLVLTLLLCRAVAAAIANLFFSGLSRFPGPKFAAATSWWKTWVECAQNWSFCHKLEQLHSRYGKVVRIGPNEIHFSDPQAYHDIYNSANRWDKEKGLYKSFNEDRSSFGFLSYAEAKPRKEALNKTFSQRAIQDTEWLIVEKINALVAVVDDLSRQGKPLDLNLAFRCLAADIITYLCFGKSVDAIHAPDFRAPLIVALDASMPGFKFFRHFSWYKNMILSTPPDLSRVLSPPTAGLVDLQQLLLGQISELTEDNNRLKDLPHQMTIYHQLMDKSSYKDGVAPEAGSLYEEGQALMFAGSDTTGNTLMHGFFELVRHEEKYRRLKAEIAGIWPNLDGDAPGLSRLEPLPYLTAVIKESLRLNCGVVSGLLRVVPPEGATICDTFVPGGTIVSCGSTFVCYNQDVFPDPQEFRPERWLDNPALDQWLVSFSRGPRSCLGINLAWAELRLVFAHFVRRFDMRPDPASPTRVVFHDCFLPWYPGEHIKALVTPAVK